MLTGDYEYDEKVMKMLDLPVDFGGSNSTKHVSKKVNTIFQYSNSYRLVCDCEYSYFSIILYLETKEASWHAL